MKNYELHYDTIRLHCRRYEYYIYPGGCVKIVKRGSTDIRNSINMNWLEYHTRHGACLYISDDLLQSKSLSILVDESIEFSKNRSYDVMEF